MREGTTQSSSDRDAGNQCAQFSPFVVQLEEAIEKLCEREVAMIVRCATIGTVHVSFLRPTERNFRSQPLSNFRGKPAVIRQAASVFASGGKALRNSGVFA